MLPVDLLLILNVDAHFLSSNRVVANSIPSIAKLIDKSASNIATTAEVSMIHQQEQMKSAMCKLIGSIATRKNPVVMFLDGKKMCLPHDSTLYYITKSYLYLLGAFVRFALGGQKFRCYSKALCFP